MPIEMRRRFAWLTLLGLVFLLRPTASLQTTAPGEVDLGFDAGAISSAFGVGFVQSILVQPDGKILIGGSFNSVAGVTRHGLARLEANGTLDTSFVPPFFPDATIPFVWNMAMQPDGKVIVAGQGLNNGNRYYSVARLNTDGSLDPSFTLLPMAVSRGVQGLLLQADGKILIGGDFSNIGADTALTMARLNADGTLDPTFSFGVPLGSYGGRVIQIVRQPDGNLIAVGDFFIDVGGTRLSHAVRLSPNGIPDVTFQPTFNSNGYVAAVALRPNGDIYIGGPFSSVNGVNILTLARLTTTGALDPAFNVNAASPLDVQAILLQDDDKLIVTGNFLLPGRQGIVRFDDTGVADSFYPPFGLGAQFGVGGIGHALAMQPDRKIQVGGEFFRPGGVPRQNIVRLLNDPPANHPPVAVDDGAMTLENVPVSIGVLANDSDPDGDPLTITSVSGAPHGLVAIGAGGTLLYTPAANYFGADTFTYSIDDGRGATDTATVSVTVVHVNSPPVAADDSYTVAMDSMLVVPAPGILANDNDIDGDVLHTVLVSGPASGALMLSADGSFTYAPSMGFTGTVTFTYRASDSAAMSNIVTVSINVEAPGFLIAATGQPLPGGTGVFTGFPGAPSLAGGLASFAALGTGGQHGFYACDRFMPGDPCLPVVSLSTAIPGGTGSFTGFGPVSSAGALTAFIGAGASEQGIFLCDRFTPGDPCLPIAASSTAIPGGTGTFTSFDDVALATRTQAPISPVVAFLGAGVGQHGVFVCDRAQPTDPCRPIATLATTIPGGTGVFTSFSGLDVSLDNTTPVTSFIGSGAGQVGVFRCEALPGDPCQPVATLATAVPGGTGTFTGFSQVAASGRFTSFIATAPGQAGVYSCDTAIPTDPCQPIASLTTSIPGGTGTFTSFDAVSSTPGHTAFLAQGLGGQAGIYVASTLQKVVAVGDVLAGKTIASLRFGRDGLDGDRLAFAARFIDSSEGVFIVDLTLPLNRAPSAVADQVSLDEDSSITFDPVANDSDPDGDALAIAVTSAANHGTIVVNGPRSVRYVPSANYAGPDGFTYTVSDGRGGTAAASVAITVVPVNDPPVAGSDSYNVTAGTTLTVTAPGVLANDGDIDGGALTAVLVSPPASGALMLSANGSFTYMPAANASGIVTFSYAAHDGLVTSAPAVVSITVQPATTGPSWQLTASLVATGGGPGSRSGHTATLLPSGNVLIAGGIAGSLDTPRSAQLYDAAARTWSLTASMGQARSGHTATLLPNGKVLVVGGLRVFGSVPVGFLDTCELYDPASGTWTPTGSLLPTAAGPTGRAMHTATLLANGKVLVVGGLGANLDTPRNAQLYDPATARWTHAGFFTGSRAGHTATVLADGKVLVAGGLNVLASVPVGFRDSALLYDPASGVWSSTGSFVQTTGGPQGRSGHTATLLRNGRVLVVGGAGANLDTARRPQIYDPATGRWSLASPMTDGRMNHTATLLPDGTILVAGGYRTMSSVPVGVLASSAIYDPASNTWSATASLNVGRAIHTATLLPDGTVLAVAGESASGRVASAEVYGR